MWRREMEGERGWYKWTCMGEGRREREEVRARAGESEDERGRKGRQGGWEIPKRQTY